MSVFNCFGGNTKKYKRERIRAITNVISEIYSPPSISAVAKMLSSFGILPGFAPDLTTHDDDGRHGDFEEDMRDRAWAKVKSEEPMLLIGSPMCMALSAWQYMNNQKRYPKLLQKS